jgi:ADP-ribosylation factor related protein 1
MYHLLRGFHEYMTRKDEFSIVIIGLDNVRSPFPFILPC